MILNRFSRFSQFSAKILKVLKMQKYWKYFFVLLFQINVSSICYFLKYQWIALKIQKQDKKFLISPLLKKNTCFAFHTSFWLKQIAYLFRTELTLAKFRLQSIFSPWEGICFFKSWGLKSKFNRNIFHWFRVGKNRMYRYQVLGH